MSSAYICAKERTLLSVMIKAHTENINLEKIFMTGLRENMFYLPAHKIIFDLIHNFHRANKSFTVDDIFNNVSNKDVDNSILFEIVSILPIPEQMIFDTISTIKEEYQKRQYVEMCMHVQKLTHEDNASADTVRQYIENSVENLSFIDTNGYTRSLAQVRAERKSKPAVTRIRTHIPFIDTTLTDKHGSKGFRNEGLVFVSGLKQSGKTFTVMRILENVSKEHPVLFGSLEFGEDLYDEGVEEAQEDGYFDGNIDNIFTFDKIYDIDKIIAEIRFQVKINGIKLVALDSMMRIINNNPNLKTDEKRLSEIFSKLGMVSKELKVPIIIVVQSSKEDLKSSMISVKGSMNADHEAYVWYHMIKTDPKNPNDERRTVIWNKNKDTHKHPKQYLMFVPQTKDFYQYEIDEHGNPSRPMHKYRKPKEEHAVPIITVYEATQKNNTSENNNKEIKGKAKVEMPEFDF